MGLTRAGCCCSTARTTEKTVVVTVDSFYIPRHHLHAQDVVSLNVKLSLKSRSDVDSKPTTQDWEECEGFCDFKVVDSSPPKSVSSSFLGSLGRS